MKHAIIFPALFCAFTNPAAAEGWPSLLVPELRRVDREESAARSELESLGPLLTGRSVQEVGFMDGRAKDPPVVAPYVQVDLLASLPIDTVVLIPSAQDSSSGRVPAYGFPLRFRVDASDTAKFITVVSLADYTDADFKMTNITPVVINVKGVKTRYIRVTATKLKQEAGEYCFALGELMVMSGTRNVAIGKPVKAPRSLAFPPRWTGDNLVDGRSALGPPIRQDLLPQDGVFISMPKAGPPGWFMLDLGKETSLEEVRLHPVHARYNSDMAGYGFPARFRVELAGDAEFSNPSVLWNVSEHDFHNPANNPVTIPVKEGSIGRFLRVTVLKAGDPANHVVAGLSEIEVYSGEVNVARGAHASISADVMPERNWPPSLLVDGYASYGQIMELPEWIAQWQRRVLLENSLANLQGQRITLTAKARDRALWFTGGLLLVVPMAAGGWVWMGRRQRLRDLERLRTRLARDFHDEIGSNLAGIAMMSETAAELSEPGGAAREEWLEVQRMAQETSDVLREVLWVAGAREGMGIDFIKHLQLAARRLLGQRAVRWLELPEAVPPAWPMEARREVFLFFKEALANVAHHSKSRLIELSARFSEGAFELMVSDDGIGFDPAEVRRGIGLQSLQARARMLGGHCEVISAMGKGTRITLRVPVSPLSFSALPRRI